MKLKYLAQTALAAAIVCTSSVTTEAQIFQDGFQSQNVVIVQQPTEEDMAKVDIGADLYDAGIGVGVRSVFTNGPAQMAGLQSGDMLTKANGEAIQNLAVFKAMVQGKAAGESVKLTRSKDGKEQQISSLKQQIENAKADLEDMAKRLADQEKQLGELKTKAAEAKVAAEKQKAADAAKKAADEAKAKEAAAAAEAANKAAQPQPEAVEGDKQ